MNTAYTKFGTLVLFILMTVSTVSSQAPSGSSYSWSDTITPNNSYSWRIDTFIVESIPIGQNLSLNQATPDLYGLQEGSIILITPIVDLQDVQVDFISIDANSWDNYFNYTIDGIQPDSPVDYFMYNLFIIPVVKLTGNVVSNVFEEDVAIQEIFSGDTSIQNGKFVYDSKLNFESEQFNFTSSGTSIWDIESGLLDQFSSFDNIFGNGTEISTTIHFSFQGIGNAWESSNQENTSNDSLADQLPLPILPIMIMITTLGMLNRRYRA